jgi:acetyl esterase/lipase
LPLPAATLDMDPKGEKFETNKERDLLVSRDVIAVMSSLFLGEGGNRDDPLVNPLHGNLRGFPPIYIQVGADETLLADSRNLAELARKSDVDVTLEIVPEMQHVFQVLAGAAPEADAAITKLVQWVRPRLGLGGS